MVVVWLLIWIGGTSGVKEDGYKKVRRTISSSESEIAQTCKDVALPLAP